MCNGQQIYASACDRADVCQSAESVSDSLSGCAVTPYSSLRKRQNLIHTTSVASDVERPSEMLPLPAPARRADRKGKRGSDF